MHEKKIMDATKIENLPNLGLDDIAQIIQDDWKNVYFGARPYLDALFQLRGMEDEYGCDPARTIVAYFLSNAGTWKGPTARAVKAELNRRLK